LLCCFAGLVLGLVVARLLRRVLELIVKHTPVRWDDSLARAVNAPTKTLCTLVLSFLFMKSLQLPDDFEGQLAKLARAGVIAAMVWGVNRSLFSVARAVADDSYARETMDPRRQAHTRSTRTQIIVATRVVSMLMVVIGVALVALQFSVVRSVGMSLLASAGVAGVVLGFAAQKSLGALLAGIQISLSQPIRIGDSVVLGGDYGTIDDIGLTYVTVKLWDERRLIVPTPRFLEQPFENWSRTNIGLLGTVFLKVDFDIPIGTVRDEFERLMDHEVLWDGRVRKLQVTDAGEQAIELRMLVSARDPGTLFDLRVSIREKLVTWLQGYEHGAHIPRTRMVISEDSNGARATLMAAAAAAPAERAILAPASSPSAAGSPTAPGSATAPSSPGAPHTPTLIGPSGYPPSPRST
jgi:small-conductance mechanosensitive channel